MSHAVVAEMLKRVKAMEAVGNGGGSGSVTVGTVTTLSSGASATVTNSGTTANAVLDFGIPVGPAGSTIVKSVLTGTQANSTVTPAVLTGCSFTLTPGQSINLTGILIATAAAITTGAALGVRVAQGAGANGNARGAVFGLVNVSSSATATALTDGDVFNVAGGANALVEVLGTATTAGNNAATVSAIITNTSTNANTTVTVEFRSEVAASAVTAQAGSGAFGVIG